MNGPQNNLFSLQLYCGPRDFHEEIKPMLEMQDPCFKPEQLSMWTEGLPTTPQGNGVLVSCDAKLDELTANQNKLQFEADSLALARDASQLARLFQEESKTERSARQAKVCHLRQENQIGSNLVAKHMRQFCHHRCGNVGDLQIEVSKANGLI